MEVLLSDPFQVYGLNVSRFHITTQATVLDVVFNSRPESHVWHDFSGVGVIIVGRVTVSAGHSSGTLDYTSFFFS